MLLLVLRVVLLVCLCTVRVSWLIPCTDRRLFLRPPVHWCGAYVCGPMLLALFRIRLFCLVWHGRLSRNLLMMCRCWLDLVDYWRCTPFSARDIRGRLVVLLLSRRRRLRLCDGLLLCLRLTERLMIRLMIRTCSSYCSRLRFGRSLICRWRVDDG